MIVVFVLLITGLFYITSLDRPIGYATFQEGATGSLDIPFEGEVQEALMSSVEIVKESGSEGAITPSTPLPPPLIEDQQRLIGLIETSAEKSCFVPEGFPAEVRKIVYERCN